LRNVTTKHSKRRVSADFTDEHRWGVVNVPMLKEGIKVDVFWFSGKLRVLLFFVVKK